MPSLPKKKRSVGRPKTDHEHLTVITFKADEKTVNALERLQAAPNAIPGALEASRSDAIRRAIQEAADRLGQAR